MITFLRIVGIHTIEYISNFENSLSPDNMYRLKSSSSRCSLHNVTHIRVSIGDDWKHQI